MSLKINYYIVFMGNFLIGIGCSTDTPGKIEHMQPANKLDRHSLIIKLTQTLIFLVFFILEKHNNCAYFTVVLPHHSSTAPFRLALTVVGAITAVLSRLISGKTLLLLLFAPNRRKIK